VTKGQRLVASNGALVSTIELDPFGGDTDRSVNTSFQPRHFTTYERDTVGGMDEAMARRYHGWWSRFSQPDPYDGSYSLTDPQSFNRYSYVQSDPVNFVDPSGLDLINLGNVGDVTIFGSFNSLLSGGGGQVVNDLFLPEEDVGERGGGTSIDPQNPAQTQTQQPDGVACDKKLAGLFGDEGAVADTGRTPSTLQHPTAGMQRFPDHSAEGGVMHLYTNAQGTAPPNSVGLYVPAGFSAVPGGRGTVLNPPGGVNPGQVNYNYAQYRNAAGVTISFVHIGSPTGPARNAAGSTRVGSIAGPGGDSAGYNHTHINFYSNFARRTRVDPRKLFCGEFGF